MANIPSFGPLVRLCEEQINNRRLSPAIGTARLIIRYYPDEPQSWYLINRLTCMSNRFGGATDGSPKIIAAAAGRLGDAFTPTLHGDMLRDQALALVTYGERPELEKVPDIIATIRKLHAGDKNRQAASLDLEGRWYFERRNSGAAIEFHERADAIWLELGNAANPTWAANNMVRWLRATVRLHGRKDRRTLNLAQRLTKEFPTEKRHAQLLTRFGGLFLFELALTRR